MHRVRWWLKARQLITTIYIDCVLLKLESSKNGIHIYIYNLVCLFIFLRLIVFHMDMEKIGLNCMQLS